VLLEAEDWEAKKIEEIKAMDMMVMVTANTRGTALLIPYKVSLSAVYYNF